MVVEITLLSSALIFVYQELTIVVELSKIVVKNCNVDSTAIIVLFALGIAIVHLYRTLASQFTTRKYNQTSLVYHIQLFAAGNVYCTTVSNDNLTKATNTLIFSYVPSASNNNRAFCTTQCTVIYDTLRACYVNVAIVCACDFKVGDVGLIFIISYPCWLIC